MVADTTMGVNGKWVLFCTLVVILWKLLTDLYGQNISCFRLDEIRVLFSGNCRGCRGGMIVELNMQRILGTRTKVLREFRRRASQNVSQWIANALDPRRAQAIAAHPSADSRLHSEQRCHRHGIPRSHENARYKRYRCVYCEYARPTYGPCGLPDDPCA